MGFFLRQKYTVLRGLLLGIWIIGGGYAQAQQSTLIATAIPIEPGSGVTRLRKIEYSHTNLSSGTPGRFSLSGSGAVCTGSTGDMVARKVILTARFHANSAVAQGGGAGTTDMHNMGANPFSAKVSLQLGSNATPLPYTAPIALEINKDQPEQTFVLDLTRYFNDVLLENGTRITTGIVANSYLPGAASYASNFRLTVTLEETYDFAPAGVSLPSASLNIGRTDGKLEQKLTWISNCMMQDYQVQLLKLAQNESVSQIRADEQAWQQRATLLEAHIENIPGPTMTWRTTLAEGYGVYLYRVRGLGNADGGVANPENWGLWSEVGQITLSAGSGVQNLADMNWIYSRTFTEGGHVAEKITFANGLLQPRQTLTRLASTQQVIGLQTLQDYVGRDALQSLPIPITGGDSSLRFKPDLLYREAEPGSLVPRVPYQAANFDAENKVNNPDAALESGYYSSTSVYATATPANGDVPLNEGVPDAQQYPFARTLFSRDGTNRVREQGSAGPVLGTKPTQPRTVRTYYASVAQAELTQLMGREAPLADKTYKIITTDPNNVSTVTYQTQDGKTVATALSGANGINLMPLPSATAAARSVVERITERTDFNGVGSVGRKILVLTEPNTAVKIDYSINPATFQDDCALQCSTCDYAVTISAYYLDENAAPELVYSASAPLETKAGGCSSVDINLPVASRTFTSRAPGTYVIEKKVRAYNRANGSTQTYFDTQAADLQAVYEGYRQQEPWITINNFLNPTNPSARNLDGLYAYLQNAATVSSTGIRYVDNGTEKYYEVPFGCAGGSLAASTVRIPVLTSNCNPPCDPTNPKFEELLAKLPDGVRPTDVMGGLQPTELDQMVVKMLDDNSAQGYAGKCSQLLACWQAQVEGYDAVLAANTAQTPPVTTPPNLVEAFLECARTLLSSGTADEPAPFMTAVIEPGDSRNRPYSRYRYVVYNASAFHLRCLQAVTQTPGLVSSNVNAAFLATLTPQQASAFYRAINSSDPNPTVTPPTPLTTDLVNALATACDDRKGEFMQTALAQALSRGVQLTNCEAEQLADELVAQCKLDAALVEPRDFMDAPGATPGAPNSRIITPEAAKRLQTIMTGTAQVRLRRLADETNCPDGYTKVPVASDGTPMQVSAGARKIFQYINNLTQQLKNYKPGVPHSLLPCPGPATQYQGIGEAGTDIFNYNGPVVKDFVLYTPRHVQANRQNYYVSIQDSRVTNPDLFGAYFIVEFPTVKFENDDPVPISTPTFNSARRPICFAGGFESPRVSNTMQSSENSPPIYFLIGFAQPNGLSIPKNDIASVSNVHLVPEPTPVPPNNGGLPTQMDGFRVDIVTTTGEVIKDALVYGGHGMPVSAPYFKWKEPQGSCLTDVLRTYGACLKWEPLVATVLPPNAPTPFELPNCQDVVTRQVSNLIQSQQQQWIDEKMAAYRARYAQQCAAPENLRDNLTLTYSLGYHHYTLYYYDRGGNLMKTVPPAGVRPLAAGQEYPPHQLVTNYKYNSLGQLVEQTTPDGGTTNFYYNRKGQLRYSLNDKQRAERKYSYTAYDALGRVTEVGESTFEYSADLARPLANIETLNVPPTGNSNITTTVYNTPLRVSYPTGGAQRYLTNRVSHTSTSDGARTAYSYDPHGNVEWLMQEVPGLGRKYVRYEYDLISNKVLQVYYQEGQPDQFYHRYRYDDDNRLLAVLTSPDGQVWEQDAEYSYYAHGPLKRAVLGDDRVQALDYTYTLQGWLKGINHPALLANRGPVTLAAGRDGNSNGVGEDAFGMTLGYFRGDYVRQGTYFNAEPGAPAARGVLVPTADQELFNGNIATWSSRSLETTAATPNASTPAAGEVFQYDQLNRLLSSRRSTYDNAGNAWTASERYATDYSYDPNGNLLTLSRRAANANAYLDKLTYNYNGNSLVPSNRLTHVDDAVGANVSAEDVDDQAPDNYGYDGVGNLTRDRQAGVQSIAWTPYGKIARVQKTNGSSVSYVYDAQGNRVRKTWDSGAVVIQRGQATNSTTYYVRDAQGNILAVYEAQGNDHRLVEQPIYGSARVGERKPDLVISTDHARTIPGLNGPRYYSRVLAQKLYELTDHLGNVRAVVTDQKTSTLDATTGQPVVSSLKPVLSAYYNYYPFGQLQPGRYAPGNSTLAGGYRFGYNGKEKDNNGELGLTSYDYGFRIYNPGIARFLSVDPLTKDYPMLTPYQFASNTPIQAIDLDGLEAKVVSEIDRSGTTVFKITIDLKVKNSSSVPTASLQSVLTSAQALIELAYTADDIKNNMKYVTTVNIDSNSPVDEKKDFYLEIRDVVEDEKGKQNKYIRGRVNSIGDTQKNRIQVSVNYISSKTSPHELGHALGLRHPAGVKAGQDINNDLKLGPNNLMRQSAETSGMDVMLEQISRAVTEISRDGGGTVDLTNKIGPRTN